MKKMFLCTICFVSLLLIGSQAIALTIDLNTFTADPSTNVSIAFDGSTALLSESGDIWGTFLYNDSMLSPSDSVTLSFAYTFYEPNASEDGNGNDDGISFRLYDGDSFDTLTDSNGNPTLFSSFSGGTGSISWELLAANVLGVDLGLEFQLFPDNNDWLTTSTLEIRNVNIASIPDASSLLLLTSAGAAGLVGAMRRRQKTTNN